MAAYIALGIGLGGIALLLLVKSWEQRRGMTLHSNARARADALVEHLGKRLAAVPEHGSMHGMAAWGRFLHAAGAFVAHTIVRTQRIFERLHEQAYRRVTPLRKTRAVSTFLTHVAEHKRRITRNHK